MSQLGSLDRTPAEVWRAARGPVAVGVLVLLGATVIAVFSGTPAGGRLDPRSAAPSGSRAVAEVLRDQGVEVELATTTAAVEAKAAAGDTVLVLDPALLAPAQVDRVRDTGADLVVVTPPDPARFARGVSPGPQSAAGVRPPGCALPAASRAGTADSGGLGWVVQPGTGAALCYARGGVPSVVQVLDGGRSVTFLGNPAALTNSRLDDEGNAALALGLLGENPRLVWYLPSLADLPSGAAQDSFYDLVPTGVWWGLVQLAVALVLVALWRARRLGPVVTEPLPVVVRASETVEGRARLYRRAGARDAAAESLRAAQRARLVPLLGLPPRAEPPAVVDAVARRAGRTPPEVATLLYGAAPADDAALVRLADDLDALEREVRRP